MGYNFVCYFFTVGHRNLHGKVAIAIRPFFAAAQQNCGETKPTI
jgi:hypothetical protein